MRENGIAFFDMRLMLGSIVLFLPMITVVPALHGNEESRVRGIYDKMVLDFEKRAEH